MTLKSVDKSSMEISLEMTCLLGRIKAIADLVQMAAAAESDLMEGTLEASMVAIQVMSDQAAELVGKLPRAEPPRQVARECDPRDVH